MRSSILPVLCLLSGVAAADHMKPGSYPDRESAWKKLSVKDIAIGAETGKLPGFTCVDKVPNLGTVCVKFLDDKCKGRATKVKLISYPEDVPPGQSCLYDAGNTADAATILDGKWASPTLSAVSVHATKTDSPRVYTIDYTFAYDKLTADSNIGKALIAKYGKPDVLNAPTQMVWKVGETSLSAFCDPSNHGGYCRISVDDYDFRKLEQGNQQAFDDEQQAKKAPAAPKL